MKEAEDMINHDLRN